MIGCLGHRCARTRPGPHDRASGATAAPFPASSARAGAGPAPDAEWGFPESDTPPPGAGKTARRNRAPPTESPGEDHQEVSDTAPQALVARLSDEVKRGHVPRPAPSRPGASSWSPWRPPRGGGRVRDLPGDAPRESRAVAPAETLPAGTEPTLPADLGATRLAASPGRRPREPPSDLARTSSPAARGPRGGASAGEADRWPGSTMKCTSRPSRTDTMAKNPREAPSRSRAGCLVREGHRSAQLVSRLHRPLRHPRGSRPPGEVASRPGSGGTRHRLSRPCEVARVPETARHPGLQVLPAAHPRRLRPGDHVGRGPERQRQDEHRRGDPLGAGRAEHAQPARRHPGRRDLHGLRAAEAAGHGRGLADDVQQPRPSPQRVHRGRDRPADLPERTRRVLHQQEAVPAPGRAGSLPGHRHGLARRTP